MTRESGTDAPDEWTPAWLETLRVQRDQVADRPAVELVAVQVGSVRAVLDELERLQRIERAARELALQAEPGPDAFVGPASTLFALDSALGGS